MTQQPIADRVVGFCAPAGRTFWEILEQFDEHADELSIIVRSAVARGDLVHTEGPEGFFFRAAFPGMDIDAAHVRR